MLYISGEYNMKEHRSGAGSNAKIKKKKGRSKIENNMKKSVQL